MEINDISKFKHLFIEEATNLLNSMESIILQLEENPANLDLIQEVFRVMHTIKGVSGMYGYDAMSDLTHHVENIYDLIRNGILKVNQDILDTTLIIVDHLFVLLKEPYSDDLKQKNNDLIAWCDQYVQRHKTEGNRVSVNNQSCSSVVTYNVIIHTHQSIVDRRINVFYAIKDLAEIGEIRCINALPVDGEEEERWSIFVVGSFSREDIEDALMFVYEYCIIHLVADFDIYDSELYEQRQDELQFAEEQYSNATPTLIKKIGVKKVNPANTESLIKSIKQNMNRVSVDSEKLDYLMYLVSELITTSSQLNIAGTGNSIEALIPHIQKIDRLSKLFRNNALEVRLIPIRDIIPKFNRMVRDLSASLGKEVEFITEGIETELDKSSIDLITEPLVHMIRNSLDHGIESPEVRLKNGKTEKGRITLKARYAFGLVHTQKFGCSYAVIQQLLRICKKF